MPAKVQGANRERFVAGNERGCYNKYMKKNNLIPILLIAVTISLLLTISGRGESVEDLAKGMVIDQVICRNQPSQSYALYLPSKYSRQKRWPILYVSDPAARGSLGVRQFNAAAENYGYIVVCSNNSRNGPRVPIMTAITAVWYDTHRRLSIDDRRIYTAGFSGGARVSSIFFNVVRHPVTGIIACGAGLSLVLKAEQVKPSLYYGIVGTGDFNYREMMLLDRTLDSLATTHQIVVYEGPHSWPPEPLCYRALEWLELQAIKQKLRPPDDRMIAGLYEKELERARNLEEAGKRALAVRAYRYVVSLFRDWSDMKEIERKLSLLAESSPYKKFLREEKKREELETRLLQKFSQVYGYLESTEPVPRNLDKTYNALEIEVLERLAREKNVFDSGLGSRQLYNLAVQARKKGLEYLQKNDLPRAIVFHEIAVRTNRVDFYKPYDHYNLACAYSRNREKKKALRSLAAAVEMGFDRLSSLETDTDLANIRGEKEFQRLIEGLKKKPLPPKEPVP